MHFPGIKVALPSSPAAAAGLLKTAIRDENPVIVIEHKALYPTSGEVSDDPDFCIPFGSAEVKREGKDVTIVATLLMVDRALKAAEILAGQGIQAEVIDPRTLVPLDEETILTSVKKNRALRVRSRSPSDRRDGGRDSIDHPGKGVQIPRFTDYPSGGKAMPASLQPRA